MVNVQHKQRGCFEYVWAQVINVSLPPLGAQPITLANRQQEATPRTHCSPLFLELGPLVYLSSAFSRWVDRPCSLLWEL